MQMGSIMVWPYLTARDISGILIAVALIAAVIFASVASPLIRTRTNYGFGPEWDCANPGKGQSVCIKHAPPSESATRP
jgi:hypothetical protein